MISFMAPAEETILNTVAKKSLSLDIQLAKRVEEAAKIRHQSFSGIVSEAIAAYLQSAEEEALKLAYKKYYEDPKNLKESADLYHDFRRLRVNRSAKK